MCLISVYQYDIAHRVSKTYLVSKVWKVQKRIDQTTLAYDAASFSNTPKLSSEQALPAAESPAMPIVLVAGLSKLFSWSAVLQSL